MYGSHIITMHIHPHPRAYEYRTIKIARVPVPVAGGPAMLSERTERLLTYSAGRARYSSAKIFKVSL